MNFYPTDTTNFLSRDRMPLAVRKAKVVVAAGIIGIGAILLLLGFLNKIEHENCIAEGRASLDEFYDTPQRPRVGAFSCPPDNSGFLFLTGSIVKRAGIVVLIAGLKDMSLVSLSRAKSNKP